MNRIICFSLIIVIIFSSLMYAHDGYAHDGTLSLSVRASPGIDYEPWSQWRGSARHPGVSNGSTPSEGKLRWSFRTADQVQSSAAFYDGIMLIGSDDGKLYALDAGTGELHWKFTTGAAVQATPLVMEDRIYFGSSNGFFYCLDIPGPDDAITEPNVVWKYDCGGPIVSSAHASGDSLIFGCQDGFFYKLSRDGDFLWKAEVGWEIWASPLLDALDDRAFIGATNGNFSCIDLDDNKVLWTIDVGEVYSSGCLWNGTIFLGSGEGHEFNAINPGNGSIIWSFETDLPVYSTPSIHRERLYFTSYERIWCLPATDPNYDGTINETEMIWSTSIHDVEGGSSPLVARGKLFVGSDDGNLYCLDMETGTILWNFTTGGYVYSSPSLYNNSIYFGSSDGSVYCVGNSPSRLNVHLESEIDEIKSGDTLLIDITVLDQNGTVVEGAALDIVLSSGDFEVLGGSGNEGESDVFTGQDGRVRILFKPPPVTSRSTIEIKVTAEKEGIEPGGATTYIVVKVGKGKGKTEDTDTGSMVDPGEKRMPYYSILVIVIITDVVLAHGIMKLTRTRSGRDEK